MRAPVVGGFNHRARAKFISWERTHSRSSLLSATTTRIDHSSDSFVGAGKSDCEMDLAKNFYFLTCHYLVLIG